MRIGEIGERSGMSTKALRYYERVGLIEEPTRTPSGYRDYHESVLARLRFIRSAQAAGLTLGEIKGVNAFRERGSPPCGHVLELIEGRASDLDQRIAELRSLRDDLRRLSQRGRRLSPAACSPDPVCHTLNPTPASPAGLDGLRRRCPGGPASAAG